MSPSGRSYQSGLSAEEIAARDYELSGAAVLARRWRCAEGEIDLIVRDGDAVVFVEVKARRTHDVAAEAISARQWTRIGRAAMVYLAENADLNCDCRFDAFLVDGTGAGKRRENVATFEGW